MSFWKSARTGSTKLFKSGLQLHIGYDTVGIAYQISNQAKPGTSTKILSEFSPYSNTSFNLRISKSVPNNADSVNLKKQKLYVRARLNGDRIHPIGISGSKKLQDIFVDKKVPKHQRDIWPIVVNDKNEVVWVPFLAASRNHIDSKKTAIKMGVIFCFFPDNFFRAYIRFYKPYAGCVLL